MMCLSDPSALSLALKITAYRSASFALVKGFIMAITIYESHQVSIVEFQCYENQITKPNDLKLHSNVNLQL